MKAMILAAGLGTRLRPLTDTRPKALVEVAGRTLLEITISRLSSFGVRDVIINVHHFPDMILAYLKAHNNFGLHIEISREEQLLDTGGGLKNASWFFLQHSAHAEEPFILHNVDVISTIDLRRMLEVHNEKQALATLAVQHRQSSRQLLFDTELRLCGRRASFDQAPELVRGHLAAALRERNDRQGTVSAVPKSVETPGTSAPEGTALPPAEKPNDVILRASDEDARRTSTPHETPTSLLPATDKQPHIAAQNHSAATPGDTAAPQPRETSPPCHSERSEESACSESKPGRSQPLQALAFSGIHIISPRLLRLMTEEGAFSIIETYLHLSARGERILAYPADDAYWRDLGKPADLAQAAEDLKKKLWL